MAVDCSAAGFIGGFRHFCPGPHPLESRTRYGILSCSGWGHIYGRSVVRGHSVCGQIVSVCGQTMSERRQTVSVAIPV